LWLWGFGGLAISAVWGGKNRVFGGGVGPFSGPAALFLLGGVVGRKAI